MADRYPLIVDTADGNQIKEIPSGDNLNLKDVSVVNVKDVSANGTINASLLQANNVEVTPNNYLKKTNDIDFYNGNQFKFLRVAGNGRDIDFIGLEEAGLLNGEFTGPIYPNQDGTLQVGTPDIRWGEVNAVAVNADTVKSDIIDDQARLMYDSATGTFFTYENGVRKKLVSENRAIIFSILF